MLPRKTSTHVTALVQEQSPNIKKPPRKAVTTGAFGTTNLAAEYKQILQQRDKATITLKSKQNEVASTGTCTFGSWSLTVLLENPVKRLKYKLHNSQARLGQR